MRKSLSILLYMILYQGEITASSGRVVEVRRAPYWGPRGARYNVQFFFKIVPYKPKIIVASQKKIIIITHLYDNQFINYGLLFKKYNPINSSITTPISEKSYTIISNITTL